MRVSLRCLSLLVLVAVAAVSLQAAEPASADDAGWAIPGERCPDHDALRALVGQWDAEVRIWTMPGQPPEAATGQAVIEEILDGRFVRTEFTGSFKGRKIEGFGVEGYDRLKHKDVGVWMDSLGTMMFHFEGSCDDGGNVRTMRGVYELPDGDTRETRTVTTRIDDNTFRFESFDIADGQELKSFEILYTRRG